MEMTAYYIPVIGAVCYVVIELIKLIAGGSERMKNLYPLISTCLGAVLAVIFYYAEPGAISSSFPEAVLIGMASGLSATGSDQIVKRLAAFFRGDNGENSDS